MGKGLRWPIMLHNKGFTLIEMLLALTLLAVIAAALYGTFFSISRARDAAAEASEQRRELRSTIDLLRREISSVLYRSNDPRLSFVVEDRDLFGAPASTLAMSVIAPFPAGSTPSSDMQFVEFKPVDREGKLVLSRSARELFATAEPLRYPQMEELKGFLVECLSNGKWVRSWDCPKINPNLPERVRITLIVREGEADAPYTAEIVPRMR